MNISEANALKARISTLERQVQELFSLVIPLGLAANEGAESTNPTLTIKRGPGRPRKEPEAA